MGDGFTPKIELLQFKVRSCTKLLSGEGCEKLRVAHSPASGLDRFDLSSWGRARRSFLLFRGLNCPDLNWRRTLSLCVSLDSGELAGENFVAAGVEFSSLSYPVRSRPCLFTAECFFYICCNSVS
jgi:hypothetical protein